MGGRVFDLHDGTPFWPRRDGILSVHPPLTANVRCEVAVVGAGITGALVALELTKRGHDVVVVDRRDAGGGSTSASTSLLMYEIDVLLVDLIDLLGQESAQLAYLECCRGIDLVEQAAHQVDDRCGFRRSPSVFIAIRRRDIETLEREFDARRGVGFAVEWLDRDELRSRWGLIGHAAIESAAGASVDPYMLCARALDKAEERGARVFERTDVVGYELGRRRVKLHTSRGAVVNAAHVVVASGYEVGDLLPNLPLRLHSTFALVSEPIDRLDRLYPDGLLFWDYDDPYLYGRLTDDRRLLVGGRDEPYRNPTRRRRALPAKTKALAATVPKRAPEIGEIDVAYSWAGTFAETPDGLAYLGGHSSTPRCQFALGYGGNGITYSAIAAEYLSDSIERATPHPAAAVFALERPNRAP